jgi:hypothetical protein
LGVEQLGMRLEENTGGSTKKWRSLIARLVCKAFRQSSKVYQVMLSNVNQGLIRPQFTAMCYIIDDCFILTILLEPQTKKLMVFFMLPSKIHGTAQ